MNIPANVGNFLTNEVEKTKEYQKKSWEEMKTQTWLQNWSQLKSLFELRTNDDFQLTSANDDLS